MKKTRLFRTIATAIVFALSFTPLLTSTQAYADINICSDSDVPDVVKEANGCSGNSTDEFSSTVVGILNGIIGIAGLVAVIFIIIGGINYMTSAGDAGKVKKGKDTILYAMIGLIICALAFAIVNWVIVGVLGQGQAQ